MTLAAKIRERHASNPSLTLEIIAEELGTSPSYVRVVLRQRTVGGVSDADRKYRSSEKWKASLKQRTANRLALYAKAREAKRQEEDKHD